MPQENSYLDPAIVASGANANLKGMLDIALGNQLANQQNAQNDAAAHRNRVNVIAEQGLGAIVKGLVQIDPIEAAAVTRIHRTPQPLEAKGDIAAALSLTRELLRSAQPPAPQPV